MIFDTISFDVNTFKGAQVDGKTLLVYTTKHTFDVDYKSAKEANEALRRLTDAVQAEANTNTEDSSTGDSLVSLFTTKLQAVKDTVSNHLNSTTGALAGLAAEIAFETAKEKVQKVLVSLEAKLDEVTTTVQESLFSTEESNQEDSPSDATKRHKLFSGDAFGGKNSPVVDSLREVFGTDKEPLIEDMSMSELEASVQQFVTDALQNPEVKIIFEEMTRFVPKNRADEAVEGLQRMIVELAVANPKAKLSQIIQKFFG